MGAYSDRLRERFKKKPVKPFMAGQRFKDVAHDDLDTFMNRRRMFCVIDGNVHIADVGNDSYHRSWMDTLVAEGIDDRTYDRSPRGFYLDGDLVWYRGPFHGVSIRAIRESLQEVVDRMQLPYDTKVYSGARTKADDVLAGECLVGTVEELLEIY